MFKRAQNFVIVAMTCVMAILLCSAQTASGKSMDLPQKSASGDFFVDELFYAAQIEPEPLNNGDWKWSSPTEIASDHALYVGNDPVNGWDPLGLIEWFTIGEGIQASIGVGPYAGLKKIKAGPMKINGPQIGATWNMNFDLAGGNGTTIDSGLTLIGVEFGPTNFGLGIDNQSGWWTPESPDGSLMPTQLVEQTAVFKPKGGTTSGIGWNSESPWVIGFEAGALLQVGVSIDLEQVFWEGFGLNGLWDWLWDDDCP